MILHIVPSLFGDSGVVGGAERYAYELAKHMARRTPTTLLSFGDHPIERRDGELQLRVLAPARKVRGQKTNPFHWSLFAELNKASIVHCHQQHVIASSLAALFSRLTRKRIFVSDLGGGGWDISGYLNTDPWYDGHLHISRYSESLAGHQGKPWSKVIYGGVDTEKFSPLEHGMPARERVLFVGRLLPHKGIHDLIAALPAGLGLDIMGRPYDATYFQALQNLASGKDVCFRTNCGDSELVSAYQKALCVVLPSVYRSEYGAETQVPELLGQTLLEGMACGAPVICTDVASMPEIVEDEVCGYVVPGNDPASLSDRLCHLRANPKLVERMGQAGRSRILSRFVWDHTVSACLDAYQKLDR